MRVLVLSVTNPVPANNGVKMRTWSILRRSGPDIGEVALGNRLQRPEMHLLMKIDSAMMAVEVPRRTCEIHGE